MSELNEKWKSRSRGCWSQAENVLQAALEGLKWGLTRRGSCSHCLCIVDTTEW